MGVKTEPKTIDYTNRRWGHDFSLKAQDGGQKLTGFIWSHLRPREGDYLILPNKGETTRYRLTSAVWTVNVDDMYEVELEFAPREEEASV